MRVALQGDVSLSFCARGQVVLLEGDRYGFFKTRFSHGVHKEMPRIIGLIERIRETLISIRENLNLKQILVHI